MADGTIRLQHGGTEHEFPLVGRTLGSLMDSAEITEIMGLQGDEELTVSVDGDDFLSESRSYVLEDGDEIRWSRSAGTKG